MKAHGILGLIVSDGFAWSFNLVGPASSKPLPLLHPIFFIHAGDTTILSHAAWLPSSATLAPESEFEFFLSLLGCAPLLLLS